MTLQKLEKYRIPVIIAIFVICSLVYVAQSKDENKLRSDLTPDKSSLYSSDSSVIEKWNMIALESIAGTRLNPPEASRVLAILHIAIFEALNSINKTYDPYHAYLPKDDNAEYEREIVVATAARGVLNTFFPNFEEMMRREMPMGFEKDEASQRLGLASAGQILSLRKSDRSSDTASYRIEDRVGVWKATPPYYESPLLPHWGNVDSFAKGSTGFTVSPPNAVDSSEYAQEYEEVRRLGGVGSTDRTEDESEIAKFWADGKGTYTPPGHWNLILQQVMKSQKEVTLEEEARRYALLNIAMSDAGIRTWHAKFSHKYWRPIDAIKMADRDENEATQKSEDWFNYIETPNFPEYPSGHSAFSGAGSAVLAGVIGDTYKFESYSLGLPGVTRKFKSFDQAAQEAGMSRIYGGIHFQKANTEGLRLGQQIGDHVVVNLLQRLQ